MVEIQKKSFIWTRGVKENSRSGKKPGKLISGHFPMTPSYVFLIFFGKSKKISNSSIPYRGLRHTAAANCLERRHAKKRWKIEAYTAYFAYGSACAMSVLRFFQNSPPPPLPARCWVGGGWVGGWLDGRRGGWVSRWVDAWMVAWIGGVGVGGALHRSF